MPLAKPKARVRQAESWKHTESLRRYRREKECLMKHRFVSIRTADVSQPGCTHHSEHSVNSWVSIPPLVCQHCSFLSFSGSFKGGLAPERWGEDVLGTTWAAKWEAQLKTSHSTHETMLFVYCRCISTGRQLPARGAHRHKSYVHLCHKLFEPLLGFILCPGLHMEAARTTTACGPAITVSGMEWLSQVPGILKIIYLYCYFI